MFHTSHIHVPRNRRPSALRTFIASSSFGPPDTKEPLRRGILLTAVAFVLLLIGSILTWLGFNDVFGGRMSTTGPLLIALSLLLLLLSFRQFLLARKRNTSNSRSSMQLDSVNRESMTAVVVNRDDGLQPATIIVDRYNRMGSDGIVTVHSHHRCASTTAVQHCEKRAKHWEDDGAPPSYHEVTRFSSRSNTPSCTTHDDQDELPPTYEETMGSSIYPSGPLISSVSLASQPNQPERNPLIPDTVNEMGLVDEGVISSRVMERDMSQSNAVLPLGRLHSHLAQKQSLPMKPAVPSLQLEMQGRVGRGMAVSNQSVAGPVMPLLQHSLTLPPSQHMSAPTSPRQLSAPPSPHPFSAPSSPRQVSPRPNVTPPPQYMSPNSSSLQLSAPPSLHILSAAPCHAFPGTSSPHFSAPSSPRPMSGGHSLTPPPQYTSSPPSPHQLSAPPSPHMFPHPRSPSVASNAPAPRHTLPQPLDLHPFPPSAPVLHQVPGVSQQSLPAPSHSVRAWASSPHHAGSNQEGYTCFTYNFITPFPVETTQTAPSLQHHTPAPNPSHRDCISASCPQPVIPRSIGEMGCSYPRAPYEGRPDFSRAHVQAAGTSVYQVPRSELGACVRTPMRVNLPRGSDTSQSSFTSRTDIQANI